ncbi:hypothetical protein GFV16_14230 [Bacillus megaterium]|uniref:hypothetical protein n=1 Tax=Priestia megaterium TaxID=1404 RepID=UPI001293FE68|nr:hypothetical protein [Priestia megaterium]MQR87067.1 hypothetical protein [Priestia megaterium]
MKANVIFKDHKIITVFIGINLMYHTLYGTLSIFTQNMLLRSLKEIFTLLLIFYILFDFIRTKDKVAKRERRFVLLVLLSLMFIGSIGLFNHNNISSYIYGIKITLIPIFSIFIGMYIKKYNVNLLKVFIVIYVLIISGWIIQNSLGLDFLLSMGYEYGVNVKNFNEQLRLPSLVGTPDGYAFLLSITGIFIQISLKHRKRLSFIFAIVTLIFLIQATIRSALTLWLVFQVFSYIQKIITTKSKKNFLYMGIGCLFLSILPLLWVGLVRNSELTGTDSLNDRLSHWWGNLPPIYTIEGIIGSGLGAVGSASMRLSSLGIQSTEYAVDNQYFALYEQVGIVGCIIMFLFLALTLKAIVESKNSFNLNVIPLVLATLFSSFFTNVLELYPFNIMLFVIIGSSIFPYQIQSYPSFKNLKAYNTNFEIYNPVRRKSI